MTKKGFDMKKYTKLQVDEILSRIDRFGEKLYLEVGGKLFDDLHASRVLPGFEPNAKIKILEKLKNKAELIFCISAHDIQTNKIRADYNLPYSLDILRQIDNMRKAGLMVSAIMITLFGDEPKAITFKEMLESRGEKVYISYLTKGYPEDVDTIVSKDGYGRNDYVKTTKPLVVVTAPGPGSGKLGTCLSQMYHDNLHGIKAGYAKYETFPIWNIPLDHPVNIAYEAATLDLFDKNMVDPFHEKAYNKIAINYNRDIASFPLLQKILEQITGEKNIYNSPTDMGINMAGFGIFDDEICQKAGKQEILRRYMTVLFDQKMGKIDQKTLKNAEKLTKKVNINEEDRPVVLAAREKHRMAKSPAVAIQLEDGTIVCGRETEDLTASSSAVINAIKQLSGVPDNQTLIPSAYLLPVEKLKGKILKENVSRMELHETLIALSICGLTNDTVSEALEKLQNLYGCEAHSSCVIPSGERASLKKVGLNLTTDPEYATSELFIS